MMARFDDLEKRLGYCFADKRLLEMALTHPSYGAEHGAPHYQRLEFLGDAVLELAVSRYLYEGFPRLGEGRLTRIRATLVREESLCEAARHFALGAVVRLSVGEERSGGRGKPSILADVMEAVIAACYLDGGTEAAFHLAERALGQRLKSPDTETDPLDHKSRLQERLQRDGGQTPTYALLESSGPAHLPVFSMRVMLGGREIGRGAGSSKRAAQQEAARDAMERMGEEIPKPRRSNG